MKLRGWELGCVPTALLVLGCGGRQISSGGTDGESSGANPTIVHNTVPSASAVGSSTMGGAAMPAASASAAGAEKPMGSGELPATNVGEGGPHDAPVRCSAGCIPDSGTEMSTSDDANASMQGDGGECELTAQIGLSSPNIVGDWRVGETVQVTVLLTNHGQLAHNLYPGVELIVDSPYWEPSPYGDDSLYYLGAGASSMLQISIKVLSMPVPCSEMVFHLRVLSFGSDRCQGMTLAFGAVVPPSDNTNCPACPASEPASFTACAPVGLVCHYPGRNADVCTCKAQQWSCIGNAF